MLATVENYEFCEKNELGEIVIIGPDGREIHPTDYISLLRFCEEPNLFLVIARRTTEYLDPEDLLKNCDIGITADEALDQSL